MTTKPITNELVNDLFERSNSLRRLVCSLYFARHDDIDVNRNLLMSVLADLEALDDKICIVGEAVEYGDEIKDAGVSQ